MEDVLEVYTRPYDPRLPQVCLDEGSKQVVSDLREPLSMQPGQSRREDYEYEREGFCSVFLACEPLVGKRVVQATARRTRQDWAHFVRELLDEHYPNAHKVVLVMDNLNTHTTGSLYEAFAPAQARALAERLEIHYTPVHGSWLNMAEIELSVLARQVLGERLANVEQVQERIQQWQELRNHKQHTISWRFTTADARIKLEHLYPKLSDDD